MRLSSLFVPFVTVSTVAALRLSPQEDLISPLPPRATESLPSIPLWSFSTPAPFKHSSQSWPTQPVVRAVVAPVTGTSHNLDGPMITITPKPHDAWGVPKTTLPTYPTYDASEIADYFRLATIQAPSETPIEPLATPAVTPVSPRFDGTMPTITAEPFNEASVSAAYSSALSELPWPSMEPRESAPFISRLYASASAGYSSALSELPWPFMEPRESAAFISLFHAPRAVMRPTDKSLDTHADPVDAANVDSGFSDGEYVFEAAGNPNQASSEQYPSYNQPSPDDLQFLSTDVPSAWQPLFRPNELNIINTDIEQVTKSEAMQQAINNGGPVPPDYYVFTWADAWDAYDRPEIPVGLRERLHSVVSMRKSQRQQQLYNPTPVQPQDVDDDTSTTVHVMQPPDVVTTVMPQPTTATTLHLMQPPDVVTSVMPPPTVVRPTTATTLHIMQPPVVVTSMMPQPTTLHTVWQPTVTMPPSMVTVLQPSMITIVQPSFVTIPSIMTVMATESYTQTLSIFIEKTVGTPQGYGQGNPYATPYQRYQPQYQPEYEPYGGYPQQGPQQQQQQQQQQYAPQPGGNNYNNILNAAPTPDETHTKVLTKILQYQTRSLLRSRRPRVTVHRTVVLPYRPPGGAMAEAGQGAAYIPAPTPVVEMGDAEAQKLKEATVTERAPLAV